MLAQVLESQCFAGAASKTVYLSVLANCCRAASQMKSLPPEVAGVPGTSPAACKHGEVEGSMHQQPAASGGPTVLELWDTIATELKALQSSPTDSTSEQGVVQCLQHMQAVAVTHEELAGGLGKSLRVLSKHTNAQVASAAAAVVATFKRQLLQASS